MVSMLPTGLPFTVLTPSADAFRRVVLNLRPPNGSVAHAVQKQMADGESDVSSPVAAARCVRIASRSARGGVRSECSAVDGTLGVVGVSFPDHPGRYIIFRPGSESSGALDLKRADRIRSEEVKSGALWAKRRPSYSSPLFARSRGLDCLDF